MENQTDKKSGKRLGADEARIRTPKCIMDPEGKNQKSLMNTYSTPMSISSSLFHVIFHYYNPKPQALNLRPYAQQDVCSPTGPSTEMPSLWCHHVAGR